MKTGKLLLFAIAVLIAFAGAIALEYGLHTYMTNSKLLYALVGGVALVIALSFAVPEVNAHRAGYITAVIFGIILMPYIAFVVGKMDLYMVDDNLARGLAVKEVRVTMDDMRFKTKEGGSVTVLPGGNVITMHPGENEVRVGTINIPKGAYNGGEMGLKQIEVDMQLDLNEALAAAKEGTNLPPGVPSLAGVPENMRPSDQQLKEEIASKVSSNIPPIGKLKNTNRDGDKITFTLEIDAAQIPFPKEIPMPEFEYPGVGGPDITLDIILGLDGRPEMIQPIIHLPPGLPAEQISSFTNSMLVSGPVKAPIFTTS